jgi:hypothetical protein
LDVSAFAPGTALTCGGCGAPVTVGRTAVAAGGGGQRPSAARGPAPAPARGPAPAPARGPAPAAPSRSSAPPALPKLAERNAPGSDTEEKNLARARLKAANQCNAALYATIGMIPAFFFAGFFGVLVVGIISIVLGSLGLAKIRRLGVGGRKEEASRGMVWAAAKMARKAPAKATLAIIISSLAIAAAGLMFYMALQEAKRVRAEQEEQRQELEQLFQRIREMQERRK